MLIYVVVSENGGLKCLLALIILQSMHHHLRSLTLAGSACALAFSFVSCAVISRNVKIVGEDFAGFADDDEKEKKSSGLKDLADVQATVTAIILASFTVKIKSSGPTQTLTSRWSS